MSDENSTPERSDRYSNPPRATDGEDERWVGEGGASLPSAYGAANDGRDNVRADSPHGSDSGAADDIDSDDPHKAEKLSKLGAAGEASEGTE